jgi:uncharacterized protein YybS (DUF2232 family)
MGLLVLRGDTVAILGELDTIADSHINYANIKAEPLQPFQIWYVKNLLIWISVIFIIYHLIPFYLFSNFSFLPNKYHR